MSDPTKELLDSFDTVNLNPRLTQLMAMFRHKFKALCEEITEAVKGREVTVALRKMREAKDNVCVAICNEQREINRAAKGSTSEATEG